MLQRARSGLGTNAGISTRNLYTRLAASIAPDLGTFLREATIVPAGSSEDGAAVVFDPSLSRGIPPELADALAIGMPLSGLRDATLSPVLPADVRARFAATTWTRAELLGDRTTSAAVAQVTAQLNPTMRPFVDRVAKARTDDDRRLGLVLTILKLPSLGPSIDAWAVGPTPAASLMSSSDSLFWCAGVVPPATAVTASATPSFLSTADRDMAKKETLALSKMGAGATWLATEAARLAEALPRDARSPEALHLAVRGTRFACKDAKTSAASKHAFQVLHRLYPGSSWAKATPYHF